MSYDANIHHDKSANNLKIQVLKTSMQNFMCPFIAMMLTCHKQQFLEDSY
jgi:hypothetical protein